MPLIDELYDQGCVKFGSFTLKSGIVSPFYIDLRSTISSPQLLMQIAAALHEAVKGSTFDLVCGVPYTALPFATALSLAHKIPMVLKRKEKKDYGTAKMCEGKFSKGQKCLVIEDVVTSGQSILETVGCLENEGLEVKDVAVLVDREQGGKALLESKGYRLYPVFTITQIVQTLSQKGKLDASAISHLNAFLSR